MSWNKVSIEQYQMLAELNPNNDRLDNEMMTLSILNRKPIEYYENMTLGNLEKELKKLQWINTPPMSRKAGLVRIGWYWYRFNSNPKKMVAEQFVNLQRLIEDGNVKNMHQVMALLTIKYNIFGQRCKTDFEEFEQRAELFRKKLDIDTALGHALFFWTYYLHSLKITLPYLKAAVEESQIGQFG